MLVDRDGYEIYDLKGKKTERVQGRQQDFDPPTLSARDSMTDAHFANFIAGIRKGEKLNAPVSVRQRRCDDAAAFEHCMGRAPRTAFRPDQRQNPKRYRSHEVLGPRIRERMGAAHLIARRAKTLGALGI